MNAVLHVVVDRIHNNLYVFINPDATEIDLVLTPALAREHTVRKRRHSVFRAFGARARHVEWTINGIQYLPPPLPTLLNIISQSFTIESDFSTPEHTFVLTRNDIIELNIHGSLNGIIHPFHLHGHAFHVIKSSDSGAANYVDPPVRDVIGVGGSGVTIRFQADNLGPWFLHCHIDWHLEAGLAVVFAEAPQDQRTGPDAEIIKDTWLDLCTIYNNFPSDQQ